MGKQQILKNKKITLKLYKNIKQVFKKQEKYRIYKN